MTAGAPVVLFSGRVLRVPHHTDKSDRELGNAEPLAYVCVEQRLHFDVEAMGPKL